MFGCLLQLRKEMDKPDSCLGQGDLLPFWNLMAQKTEAVMNVEEEVVTSTKNYRFGFKVQEQEQEKMHRKSRLSPSMLIELWERYVEFEAATASTDDQNLRSERLIERIKSMIVPQQLGSKYFKSLLAPWLVLLPESMQNHAVSLSKPVYGELYYTALTAVQAQYIPSKPDVVVKRIFPPIKCKGSQCSCKDVNKFLTNPQQDSTTMISTYARQKHIHQRLDESECRDIVEHTTDHTANADVVLRLKKLKGTDEKQFDLWNERYKEVQTLLEGIGRENLMELLGKERYEEVVVQLFGLPKPGVEMTSTALTDSSGNARAGAKRKPASNGNGVPAGKKQRSGKRTNVVDLTGEE